MIKKKLFIFALRFGNIWKGCNEEK
jgi:hypothetical protein